MLLLGLVHALGMQNLRTQQGSSRRAHGSTIPPSSWLAQQRKQVSTAWKEYLF
jgi:hypothetical protein